MKLFAPSFFLPEVTLHFVVLVILCAMPMAVLAEVPVKPKPVIIAPVKSQVIYDRIEALGTTRSIESIQITSSVTEKIKALHFDDGQRVKRNQLLVELEKNEQQAELARAEAIRGERELTLQRLRQLDKKN